MLDRHPVDPTQVATPAPTVGELLRAARRHADLSQRQLAAVSGVSRRTIERLESEQSPLAQDIRQLL
ncbi:MAG: helix-turn-helix transcriptional regulator, partial [Actinomycetes bacterium]